MIMGSGGTDHACDVAGVTITLHGIEAVHGGGPLTLRYAERDGGAFLEFRIPREIARRISNELYTLGIMPDAVRRAEEKLAGDFVETPQASDELEEVIRQAEEKLAPGPDDVPG